MLKNIAIASVIVTALASVSFAGPFGLNTKVTDYNFDGDTLGAPPPQTIPSVDSTPQGTIYALGGFPDVGPFTGTTIISDVGSLNKAALMTTTQGGTGANYMDTQFNFPTSRAVLDFDLNVVDVPTSGLPQTTATAAGGQAFVLQAFGQGPVTVDRVFRFVVTPTSETGGAFAMRNNTDGDVVVLGTYVEGETHHVQIHADFATQTLDVYLNNVLALNNHPFISQTNSLLEYFIFQNGIEGQTNSVAIDNIVTYVPEPASLGLLGLGAMLIGRRRRM